MQRPTSLRKPGSWRYMCNPILGPEENGRSQTGAATAAMVARRERNILSLGRRDDGSHCGTAPSLHLRHRAPAVHRTLRALRSRLRDRWQALLADEVRIAAGCVELDQRTE